MNADTGSIIIVRRIPGEELRILGSNTPGIEEGINR